MTCIKHGDKYPFKWKVNHSLVGATSATLLLRSKAGGSTISETLDISDPANGVLTWDLDGTIAVGVYDTEVEIVFGSDIRTTPSCGYVRLEVEADL